MARGAAEAMAGEASSWSCSSAREAIPSSVFSQRGLLLRERTASASLQASRLTWRGVG